MLNTRKIPIVQLNDFLTCKICRGYYIDATTITECLHTFCRSCIVQYLAKNNYCPVCDVQVHKSKPLLNIRPDKIIQDIVYKLVPHLFQNEMCKRRQFYSAHPDVRPSNLEQCREAAYQYILSADEKICLTLNYTGSKGPPRYLRCSAGLSVMHLQKLLRSKYGLLEYYRVDIFHNQDCLSHNLTLMDIAYIYLWKRKGPLELTYTIYQNSPSVVKSETEPPSNTSDGPGTNWKEVQLQISETGEMCFTNVDSNTILDQEMTKTTNKDSSESLENTKTDTTNLNEDTNKDVESESTSSSIHTNVDCDNNSSVIENCISTTPSSESEVCAAVKPTDVADTELVYNGKHKIPRNVEEEPVAKQTKPTILNHTLNLGINHLSNNHPLKRNSQTRKSIESVSDNCIESLSTTFRVVNKTTANSINFVNATHCSSIQPKPTIINKNCMASSSSSSSTSTTTVPHWSPKTQTTKLPCYTPKVTTNPVITVPKVQTTSGILKSKVPITTIVNHKMTLKNKPTNTIGYKTLREPPKSWNPQIPRSLLLKGAEQKDSADVKNTKPAKFFKMRNNMPRYLGNPASGVKPLYQVHNSPEKDKSDDSNVNKVEIKKHSIVKIDPKTLKPISEKAPESTSLSTQSELKINTSSVPIFSPLKLQSSPKSDRRSPKSPQSPKSKTSPSAKREKLNLNFIPPNPFIPNLTSPTLNPNQFLYPPGFPTYDHRLVAAYHNLLFGQRFAFAASHPIPNFDLTLRASTSPTASTVPPRKEKSSKKTNEGSPKSRSTENGIENNLKKKAKESIKNEKSLQNTVEKLTQNRVSELKKVGNGTEKEPSSNESPETKCNDNSKSDSNNIEDKKNDSDETETNIQSIQNSDKTVNNNSIESVSLENGHKV